MFGSSSSKNRHRKFWTSRRVIAQPPLVDRSPVNFLHRGCRALQSNEVARRDITMTREAKDKGYAVREILVCDIAKYRWEIWKDKTAKRTYQKQQFGKSRNFFHFFFAF